MSYNLSSNMNFVSQSKYQENNLINNIQSSNIKNNTIQNNVKLHLVMSCDIFWSYETYITIDRNLFHPRFTNRTEQEAFERLSEVLCYHMKHYIEDSLRQQGRENMLPMLEKIYPKFHIHGQTVNEILYPHDPTNSAHCRGDGKIFICTHC